MSCVPWACGIRHFNVARSYGLAEDFLGVWLRLRDLSPSATVVSSKWGYIYAARWRADADVHEVKNHSLATLRRQIGESRQRLGEYLDLYQIHSVTPESDVLDDTAVLNELALSRTVPSPSATTIPSPHRGWTSFALRRRGLEWGWTRWRSRRRLPARGPTWYSAVPPPLISFTRSSVRSPASPCGSSVPRSGRSDTYPRHSGLGQRRSVERSSWLMSRSCTQKRHLRRQSIVVEANQ